MRGGGVHRLAAALSLGLLAGAAAAAGPAFDWVTASPASQGMDEAKLLAVQREMAKRNTKTLLIIRNDRIVLEWYAEGHGPEKLHYTASLAKSLVGGMSLLAALDEGRIGVDDPVSKFLPAWKNDPVRAKITIRQLATHTSGIEDAEEGGKPHEKLPGWKGAFWRQVAVEGSPGVTGKTPTPISIALEQAPVIFEPGTGFAYSNPGMAVLAWSVTAAMKGTAYPDIRTLLWRRIMEPIGIRPEQWSAGYNRTYLVNGLPVVPNWGGAGFTARSIARIGRLLMRKGDWQGKQVIGRKSVERMLSEPGTAQPEGPSRRGTPVLCWYSNRDGIWENIPRDAFRGSGAGDQVMLVVPSLNLIVVRHGNYISTGKQGEDIRHAQNHYLFDPIIAAIKQ